MSNKDLTLSIIVPFYNVEHFIRQCIDSILNQDLLLSQYEVICINDCSPDNSKSIVNDFISKYPNIFLVEHTKNLKLGGARNTGLKYAKGKYIWFIDSDDYIKPCILKQLIYELENNDLDFLHFDYDEDCNGTLVQKRHTIQNNTGIISGTELFFYDGTNWSNDHVTAWRKIYNRRFLIDNFIFFEENIMYEDNDYAFRLYRKAKRTKHINLSPYVYRNNASSITRTNVSLLHIEYWITLNNIFGKLKQQLLSEDEDIRYIYEINKFIKWNTNRIIIEISKIDRNQQTHLKKALKRQFSIFKPIYSTKAFLKLFVYIYCY